MVESIIGVTLFFASAALLGLVIQRLSPLDMTLSCLLSGAIIHYLIEFSGSDMAIQDHSMKEIVFFIILPVLIFEAAWHIDPRVLIKWLRPILLLAIPGVLLSCLIMAVITYYLIGNSTAYPWIAAFIVGAILAATDPVAVTATLKVLKAPENLNIVIEGESLFNDATAVLLFSIVITFIDQSGMMHSGSDTNILIQFLIVCLGGHLLGASMGSLAALLINWLESVPATKMILLLLAFASFYVAEHLLHVSGILSVMTAAIVVRRMLCHKRDDFLYTASAAWEWMALLFTSMLFVIMGSAISLELFIDHWLAVVIAILAALVARLVAVYSMTSISSLLGQSVPSEWKQLLVWGGLRGGIAIALVLSLSEDLAYYDMLQAMVFGLVLFTLLVQGTTAGKLIRQLKII